MFSPPFENVEGKPIYEPMAKDAVLYGGTDPGRFNPTYMIFAESFTPPEKRRDPEFDRRDVYLITQNALADGTYLDYIRAHYNRSTQIDPYFFSELLRGPKEIEINPYDTDPYKHLLVLYMEQKRYTDAAEYSDKISRHGGKVSDDLKEYLKEFNK